MRLRPAELVSLLRPAPLVAALVALVPLGCGESDAGSSLSAVGAEREVFGSAILGGSPDAGSAWREAALVWPKEGNISLLFENPGIQAQFANWMRGEGGLSPLPEPVLPSMTKLQGFNDRLILIDGAWGPMPSDEGVRPMAMRGLQQGLWYDIRHSATAGDADRVTDLLVCMGTVPRILHAYDGTVSGLIDTVKYSLQIAWALDDVAGIPMEFDDAQRERIAGALVWMDDPAPFGVADPEVEPGRAAALERYETSVLPQLETARARVLGGSGDD